ncbi:MAG: hypothetical protein H6R25_2114 [Proteobacteria bacterium]|nr:hypothetical protein [Pseudomonadota bacterium]
MQESGGRTNPRELTYASEWLGRARPVNAPCNLKDDSLLLMLSILEASVS